MIRTNHRHLYTVLLILLLSLGTVGIAYGQWTDTLVISGSVTTGELDVDWIDYICNNDINPNPATIRTELVDENDTIKVMVENGYPGYAGNCMADSQVLGSLPTYIKDIDFTPGTNLTNCTTVYDQEKGSFTALCDQLWVKWTNGLNERFSVGSGEGSTLRFSIFDGARQSTDYGFTITYLYEQDTP